MAHPLAFSWTSKIISDNTGNEEPDVEGLDLDLTRINERNGSLANCTQGGNSIRGDAKELPAAQRPLRYRIKINHQDGATHRGFAVENNQGQITKIVGALIGGPFAVKAKGDKELADQTEATWVATKGG